MIQQNLSLDSRIGKIKSQFNNLNLGRLVVDDQHSHPNADGKYVFTARLEDNSEFKITASCRNYPNAKEKFIKKLANFVSKHKNGVNKYKKWKPRK